MKPRIPRKLKKKLKKFYGFSKDYRFKILQFDFPVEPMMTRKRKKMLKLLGDIAF